MKHLVRFALVAALATPALAADTVITTSKHTDAMQMMGQEIPAKDSTEVTWLAKDKLRIEEGDKVTIIRGDQKKMYIIHPKDKTFSAVDLPFDLKKALPPEMAPMIEQMMGQMKFTVTPTTETKKVKDWNTTKYTMTMSGGMFTMTQTMWVTKDIKMDCAAFKDLYGSVLSMMPGGASMVSEMQKLDGFPVLVEQSTSVMGSETKGKEEVTSVESKDAPEGNYDVPKDFKEQPFDWMSDNPSGGMGGGPGGGGRGRGAGHGGPGRPPADKPKPVPVPEPK